MSRKIVYIIPLIFLGVLIFSCDKLKVDDPVKTELSESEIVDGLKEALNIGIQKGADKVSLTDGYFGDLAIKIFFPPEAIQVKNYVENDLGQKQLVDDFIKTLNRAAESAAHKSKPIFLTAIKNMTFQDARKILTGGDSLAATNYLKNTTSDTLKNLYKPDIKTALDSVYATKYWGDIIYPYNLIYDPDVTTDLPEYTTDKALYGLFYMVGVEEKKIRKDPVERATDILKKVFGSLDK